VVVGHRFHSCEPAICDPAVPRYAFGMKISARNIFRGQVLALTKGAVNSEVIVAIAGGEHLTAVITNDSALSLGLAIGSEVFALFKASSVLVMIDGSGVRLSARNCLAGTITAIQDGVVDAAVTIALPGGGDVCAVVTHDAVVDLALAVGMPATAVIKASSVILAVHG
jgi:molybdate transport system regulatory protein